MVIIAKYWIFKKQKRLKEVIRKSLYYSEMNNTYGVIQRFCRDAGYSLVHGNYIQHSYRDFIKIFERAEKGQAHEKAEGH